jgi:hypothetical protein
MSIAELKALLGEQGGQIDWEWAQEKIQTGHRQATSKRERIKWLKLYNSVMDAVERDTLLPPGLPEFRKTRAHGFRVLLLQEVEEDGAVGLMDPRRILPITSREVRAGRLSPTDDLHRLALRGADPARKAGLFTRLTLRVGTKRPRGRK